jgi:hypothetical protein
MVAKIVECAGEACEDFLILQFRDILHGDQLGVRLADETCELVEQKPSFVAPCRLLIVFGERLARRAPGKKRNMARAEIVAHLFRRYFYNRLVQESRMIVMLVRILAAAIEINAHAHVNAGLPQTASKPTAAAEQVYGVDSAKMGIPFRWPFVHQLSSTSK